MSSDDILWLFKQALGIFHLKQNKRSKNSTPIVFRKYIFSY